MPGSRRAVVIFVHGLWGNRLALFSEARLLAKHGYGFLLYDSRASGESDGDVATWGDREQLDVHAVVDYVSSRPEVDASRIALLGFSVGGSAAAMAVSHDPRPRALVLYATWSSLDDEMEYKFGRFGPISFAPVMFVMRRAGVVPDNIRPIDHLRAIHPRPLLMITGTLDDDTPVAVMAQLFQAAGEPKELWIVPGAKHGGYLAIAPEEYETRVVSFLDRALFGPAPPPGGS
jgi:dipeptidyl aminopeptidase/acylaminoacyl peptidase